MAGKARKKTADNEAIFMAGLWAYDTGQAMEECPYEPGDEKRLHWLSGYIEARTQDRLAHVFKKFNTQER